MGGGPSHGENLTSSPRTEKTRNHASDLLFFLSAGPILKAITRNVHREFEGVVDVDRSGGMCIIWPLVLC